MVFLSTQSKLLGVLDACIVSPQFLTDSIWARETIYTSCKHVAERHTIFPESDIRKHSGKIFYDITIFMTIYMNL